MKYITLHFVFLVFFVIVVCLLVFSGVEDQTQGLTHVKQEHLPHSPLETVLAVDQTDFKLLVLGKLAASASQGAGTTATHRAQILSLPLSSEKQNWQFFQ